ncbi:MAG TPA: VOC family protein [Acidimicrobiales bacterium]|nr:VOC family protein [Acidimicrobiales bacterium]
MAVIMPHPAKPEAGFWHSLRMPIDVLFSGVATADLEAAIPWYDALLGRPADVIPNGDEVMWRICEGAWLYLIRDPTHAGHGLVTVSVADLDQTIAEIGHRGLDRPPIETIEGAGRKAPFVDPDGNTITFVEVAPPAAPPPPSSRRARGVLRW